MKTNPGVAVVLLILFSPALFAAEGMWLFNRPPARQLAAEHGFDIPEGWLDHLRESSIRFNSGGSASFVSSQGLVLTNHHVGSGAIQKLSTHERDLLKEGFYASTLEEELRCEDLEINVLRSIEDVTKKVNAVVSPEHSTEEALAARREAIARIEKNSLSKTGLHSEVVTLYRGGAYHLYRYKRYTDVRLVFAPELQAAFFGGDPDNFSYPRYCFDLCFFRVYENERPLNNPHFLRWNAQGAAEGELIFVSGHPGRTNRLNTLAQLEAARDLELPYHLERLFRREVVVSSWARRDRENQRRAKGLIFGLQNGRKARRARLQGLLDPRFMKRKAQAENKFREVVRAHPEWAEADRAFDDIAQVEAQYLNYAPSHRLLESGDAFDSKLFRMARSLVRTAEESSKPDGDRLEEYQDANRASFELALFSPQPIYKDLEMVKLTDSLTFLCGKLGKDHFLVEKIMEGKSPQERAWELVGGTKVQEVAFRREFYEGGKQALTSSSDPMIALAQVIDEAARKLRHNVEALGETTKQAHRKIAQARFALEGDSIYPDATFTLRLSYGIASGYEEGGQNIPMHTTFAGLYERSQAQEATPPFHLPSRWLERKEHLDLTTPYNFVSTHDITGGNSGSPVVNAKGELVGLIFDSNTSGLVLDFGYSEETARSVSVHAGGMLEGLRKIYQTKRLVEELTVQE